MTSKTRLHSASLLPLVASLSVAACGLDELDGTGSGGNAGAGGSSTTGGAGTGGVSAGATGKSGSGATAGAAGAGALGAGGALSSGGAGAGTGGAAGGVSASGGAAGTNAGTAGGAGTGTGGANAGSANAGAGGAAGGAGAGGMSAGAGGRGGAGGAAAGAGGTPVASGYPENTGADCASTAAPLGNNAKFPDPFVMHDGTRIGTRAQWACRRNEIKQDIEKFEIGPKPEPPTVEASVSGTTLNVKVTTSAGSITLTSTVGTATGTGPHCVAIGMNSNSSMINGCVQIPFKHDQVVGYNNGGGSQSQSDPFYELYPDLWGKIGNYTAWSWGISRLIDGIEQMKTELNVDPTKIGVHGCSYAGKMALFGGAFDERVALTVAQESGGGGITSWRTSQDFADRTGTNVEKIDNTNYAWFLSSMKTLAPHSLPHDHHELIAMIAPRAVIALGNQDFEWLGDESGYKSINAAKEVWKALGAEASIGFDFTSNHGHCMAPASQTNSVNAFVNKFLKGQDANTAIAIQPQEGGFDLNFASMIDWQTPTLQ